MYLRMPELTANAAESKGNKASYGVTQQRTAGLGNWARLGKFPIHRAPFKNPDESPDLVVYELNRNL